MRVHKQTHGMAKLTAFVMSFAAIGVSDALAENTGYQDSLSQTAIYSDIDVGYQTDMTINRIKGVELAMPSSGTSDWRVGLGFAGNSFVVNTPNKNRSFVLYFRSDLKY